MDKRKKLLFVPLSSLFIIIVLLFSAAFSENESILLENFDQYKEGDSIADKWLMRSTDKTGAPGIYKIAADGKNVFLNAFSNNDSIQIVKKVNWDIKRYPVLSWRWKAVRLPDKGNEEVNRRNDSGASIYVIFQRSRIPMLSWEYQPINVIKYIWSTELPEGRIVNKKKTKIGKIIYEGRFIVIESGPGKTGEWITEERNVLEDYKNTFGENPKYNPYLIGILTDSNNTKTSAEAAYDEFIIRKTAPAQ